ncbi:hypothetical protein [Aliiruegeria sabulilitoris]|uniref:hypothetical protein n=1 Tax=Aliiruegeria sabulilitoris TaxID=1510458 RepID=UPI00082E040E|nr:hypothetical protein [Aliiruegeria sabulilitoris]NDR59656.1 hypothetical protein [Pseudoruegeria sp. M32A2M]
MIPPITDINHLNEINAERFRRDSFLLHATVNLPESPAVRAEIAAMLDNAERDAPPKPRPAWRLRVWFPRWIGWLRAMPIT